jgi:hypothetical protein
MNDHSKNDLRCKDPLMSAMLADYFMGNLEASDADRFEDHFISCEKCHVEYEELAELLMTARDCREEVLAELAIIRAGEEAEAQDVVPRKEVTKSAWTLLKERIDAFLTVRLIVPAMAVAALGLFLLQSSDSPPTTSPPPIVDKTIENHVMDTSTVSHGAEITKEENKTKFVEKKQATVTETKNDTSRLEGASPVDTAPTRRDRTMPGTIPTDLINNTPMALRNERLTPSPPSQSGGVAAPTNPVETENPQIASTAGVPGSETTGNSGQIASSPNAPGNHAPATGSTANTPVFIVPDIVAADLTSRGMLTNDRLALISDGLRQKLQSETGCTVSKTPQVPILGKSGKTASKILVRTAIRAVEGKQDEVLLEIVMTDAVTGKILKSETIRCESGDVPERAAQWIGKQ